MNWQYQWGRFLAVEVAIITFPPCFNFAPNYCKLFIQCYEPSQQVSKVRSVFLQSTHTLSASYMVRPTLAAVRILSPVMIKILQFALLRLWICFLVSSLSGELQMKNPTKVSQLYTRFLSYSLPSLEQSQPIYLEARASNLQPCFVQQEQASLQLWGTSFNSNQMASGAPFTKDFILRTPLSVTCSTMVVIRFSSDLKGNTLWILTFSSPLLASLFLELYSHLAKSKNISSIGSPVSSFQIDIRLWQPASTTKFSCEHSLKPLNFLQSAQSSTIPSKMNLSSVRVPVLSKATVLALPPKGIFLGSLINILFFCRQRMELLTARLRIIGNYGGTTVVRMSMHLKNSFSLLRYSLSMPLSSTQAEVISEQMSKKRMIHSPSFCQMVGFQA